MSSPARQAQAACRKASGRRRAGSDSDRRIGVNHVSQPPAPPLLRTGCARTVAPAVAAFKTDKYIVAFGDTQGLRYGYSNCRPGREAGTWQIWNATCQSLKPSNSAPNRALSNQHHGQPHGLFGFDVPGARYDRDWVRVGGGVEARISGGTGSLAAAVVPLHTDVGLDLSHRVDLPLVCPEILGL